MPRPKIDNKKKRTSFALSDDARRLLKAVADKRGLSQATLLEVLIREAAKKDKVE